MLTVRGPNIRVPPAILVAGFLVGLILESYLVRLTFTDDESRMLADAGFLLIALGSILALSGVATFAIARTTMFPFEPASALVQRGPYRFTRNPMYLGLSIMYVGAAFIFNTAWPMLLLPAVLFALYRLVIREEEKYLEHRFGEEYLAYKRRVRRWL